MWTDSRAPFFAAVGLVLIVLLACDRQGPPVEGKGESEARRPVELIPGRSLPRTARPEILQDFRETEVLPVGPGDGLGSATVEPAEPFPAGAAGSWTVRYRAVQPGIATGGALILQVSPFWGWSDPQTTDPERPGFTQVSTSAAGVQLSSHPCGQNCLHVGVEGGPIPAGEEISIRYGGPGTGAAWADRFAEREEEFFLRVDGDGDGVSAPLENPPHIDLLPGPAAALHAVIPSTARSGEPVWLHVAALDRDRNPAPDFEGELVVVESGGLEGLPDRLRLGPDQAGVLRLPARAGAPGVARVSLAVPGWEERFQSNPMLVEAAEATSPRLLWADLHGHTGFSDGTGTPEDYFRYARDVAALDAAAITDHDHWGLRFLDREPELWERIQKATRAAHAPGRFVAILGYEWTSWIFGHRHVLYFEDDGEVLGSTDEEFDEPEELWARLRGRPALTVPHHPGGGPIAIDWSIPPDPELEPVVEIVSVHGSSECAECPAAIYSAVPGSGVQAALGRGYRLGIIGSGDTHDGHPGLGSPGNRTVGLTGLLAERHDRAAILDALRKRRVYATSGARILLRFAVEGTAMGGTLRVTDPGAPRAVYVRVLGTAPLEVLEIVKDGQVVHSVAGRERDSLELLFEDPTPARDGEVLYVRVRQVDGGLAWSSPVWLEFAGEGASPADENGP